MYCLYDNTNSAYAGFYDFTPVICNFLPLASVDSLISIWKHTEAANIVNQHKKSRDFLYSFNTLILSKRYCNIVFQSVQSRQQRERKEKPDGISSGSDMLIGVSSSDPAKQKACGTQNTEDRPMGAFEKGAVPL